MFLKLLRALLAFQVSHIHQAQNINGKMAFWSDGKKYNITFLFGKIKYCGNWILNDRSWIDNASFPFDWRFLLGLLLVSSYWTLLWSLNFLFMVSTSEWFMLQWVSVQNISLFNCCNLLLAQNWIINFSLKMPRQTGVIYICCRFFKNYS